MDLKFNRKVGALVLVAAILVGSAIGLLKGAGDGSYAADPDSTLISNLVDDRAGVLDSSAASAVENVRENTRGTLLVLTVPTTGGVPVYDYTLDTAQSLAEDGRLSDTTGMLLVLAIEDNDYAFVYGSDLWELDYYYEDLLYDYLEPDFAKGRYADAVEEFCDELDDTVSDEYYDSSSDDMSAVIGFIVVLVIVIIVISSISKASRRRSSYTRSHSRSAAPFIFVNNSKRPPMPPRPYQSTPPRSSSSRPSGGFSGGSRSGFSGSSRSSFSGSSRSSFGGSSRSSFSGGSRGGFSGGSRGGFSGGSRGGFSGGGRK